MERQTEVPVAPGWAPTVCVLCSQTCGIRVAVEERRIIGVRGDRDDPATRGYLCNKALRLDSYQNPIERLSTPLRRRADGAFEPISWRNAETEIADRLRLIRDTSGGETIALYGGGGQGNHLGGSYALSLLDAVGGTRWFNASAQENTGEWWVNRHLFGGESCHPVEDAEHTSTLVLVGTNPWQSHTVPAARRLLRDLADDTDRQLVVLDPRRTETADLADVHLQLRPGSDVFLLAAMLAMLVERGAVDTEFIVRRVVDADHVLDRLAAVPIDDFIAAADVARRDVDRAIDIIAAAPTVAVRDYMGVRHNRHSALSTYLCRLLSILTGNVGRAGGINLHSWLYPRIRDTVAGAEVHSPVTGQLRIGGIYPPNRLPEEILGDHPKRIRALIVDSANPAHTSAGSSEQREALGALDLLVVVDVAMTETARLADFVLPAASQYEKWEMTLFTHGMPDNVIHVRRPVMPPWRESRPERLIYRGILDALGALPDAAVVDRLRAVATEDRSALLGALIDEIGADPSLFAVAPVVLADVLEPTVQVVDGEVLPAGAAAAAPLWFACHQLAGRDPISIERAGVDGSTAAELAEALFDRILTSPSGTVFSHNEPEDTWTWIKHPDGTIHAAIPELLAEFDALDLAELERSSELPFVLAAGQRRSWNANAIMRDGRWRRGDHDGALLVHPDDLDAIGSKDGDTVTVISAAGHLVVRSQADPRQRRGDCVLPHGYGMGSNGGPAINELTSTGERCPIAGTPHHKYVPVRLEPA